MALAAPEHQKMNRQLEVTWITFRTIAHSLMVHARVLEAYIHFALMHMTDHIFPVLPIKDTKNKDGDLTTPFKLATGTKPSADDGLEFIRCNGGQKPEIHEVWTFGDNIITPEVHPFARVDVSAFIGDCFGTNYLAGNGRRVPMFGRKLINGSVKWIGVPGFMWNDGLH